ncbi:GAP family protein [Svornostia abyssi]|uniref:GAP family protein n=1 Tax=Svornostia abyssi TaxID=2898438 RepID=A0ABY5PJM8_9ACTN|nr:GAP family protein [Parviterribacteraceae bacterium J379]
MGELLATVLPLALGAAVSPTLAALVIAVLASGDDPVRRGVALTAGAAVPLVVIAAVVLLTMHAAGAAEPGPKHRTLDGVIDLVFGVLLAAVAWRALQPTPTPQEQQAARAVDAPGGTARYVALGVGIMLVNFSTLALFVPAMKDIARAGVPVGQEIAAVVVVLVIVLIPAWVPVALRVAFPDRTARVLRPLGRWMHDNQRALGGWVSAAFAAYLVLRGVLELR